MAYYQSPPELGSQYQNDPLIREYAARIMPGDVLAAHAQWCLDHDRGPRAAAAARRLARHGVDCIDAMDASDPRASSDDAALLGR